MVVVADLALCPRLGRREEVELLGVRVVLEDLGASSESCGELEVATALDRPGLLACGDTISGELVSVRDLVLEWSRLSGDAVLRRVLWAVTFCSPTWLSLEKWLALAGRGEPLLGAGPDDEVAEVEWFDSEVIEPEIEDLGICAVEPLLALPDFATICQFGSTSLGFMGN